MAVIHEFIVRIRHPDTFDLLCEVDDYIGLTYKRRYQRPGEFEMTVGNENIYLPKIIMRNAIVEILRNGLREFTGRVKHITADMAEDGDSGLVWKVSGPDLSDCIRTRLALPNPTTTTDSDTEAGGTFDTQTAVPASTAMRYYVNRNVITCNETARNYSWLVLGRIQKPSVFSIEVGSGLSNFGQGYDYDGLGIVNPGLITDVIPAVYEPNPPIEIESAGSIVSYKARWQTLLQVITDLAKAGGVGFDFRLEPDLNAIYFDVCQRADRTEGNVSGYSPAIFSVGRDNLRSFQYIDNGLDTTTALYVAGDGSATTRALFIAIVDEATQETWFVERKYLETQANITDNIGQGETIIEAYYRLYGPNIGSMTLQQLQSFGFSGPLYRNIPLIVSQLIARETYSEQTRTWGRQEAFVDLRQEGTSSNIEDQIQQYIAEYGNKQTISFQPFENDLVLYRAAWDVGDIVTIKCDPLGIVADAPIYEVSVSIDGTREPEITVAVGTEPMDHIKIIKDRERETHSVRAV